MTPNPVTSRQRYPNFVATGRAAALFSGAIAALMLIWVQTGVAQTSVAQDRTDIRIQTIAEQDRLFGTYLALGHAEDLSDFGRSAELLDRLLQEKPDDSSLLRRAFVANLYSGRYERMAALAPIVADQHPDQVDIATVIAAAIATKARDWDRALDLISEKQNISLARFAAPVMKAWILQATGKTDAAIKELEALREYESISDMIEFNAALIFLAADRPEDAEKTLGKQRSENIAEMSVEAVRAYARAVLALSGVVEAARTILEEYEAAHGGNFARVRFDLMELEQSGTLPVLAPTTESGIAKTFRELAIRIRRQAPMISLEYLRAAVFLDEDSDLSRIFIGAQLSRLGRDQDAVRVLSQIQPTSIHGWSARQELSDSLIALERDQEAIALLEDMAKERPDAFDPLGRLGGLMRSRSRFEEGSDYYQRALERIDHDDPDAWPLFYGRAITYERTDQWSLAEADLQRALALNPDAPYALNYLGYSWVDQGIRVSEGLALIERAVEQRRNDPYIVDSLGWAHYRLGNFDEAVTHLERSVQLRPGNAVINDHLGDAYWHVGRRTEARFQWERSRYLEDADDALRARIDAKLARGLGVVEAEEADESTGADE